MKSKNLIIWAGLMCACFAAFLSCAPITKVAQFIGLRQEKVKLTPEELQRLVYSSHVLTIIDDKPELEGALLALRELHRENPQASPATLVSPVKWALQEYRKEDSSRTLPVTWRDEVLGRYFLTLCDALEPGDRPEIALNLLKVLLADPTSDGLAELPNPSAHAASQRLLAFERGPGERQALVESCMEHAQSDPNFATVMDELLHPEVEIALSAPPGKIFAANAALAQSPTMKELMRLSSSSEDGNVVITLDKLKDLFAHEVAVTRDAVTTHLDLSRNIERAQERLVRYPDEADKVAVIIQRHAEAQAGQRKRIAASSAGAKKLSDMMLSKHLATAKELDITSKALGLLGSGLGQIGGAFTNPVGAVGGMCSLAGASMQFNLLTLEGPPPEKTILDSVQLVGEMISDLSVEMGNRFDRVDRSLVYILRDLRSGVLLVGEVGKDVEQVRKSLLAVQGNLRHLKRELYTYLDAGFRQELVTTITGSFGRKEPMKYDEGYMSYREAENNFYTWAAHFAKEPLRSYRPEQVDLGDNELLGELTDRPLESNLNYIKEFIREEYRRQGLGPFPLSAESVVSPLYWYIGANAYLRLAAENPQHFRRIDPNRVDKVIQAGTELEDFFRKITFVKSGRDAQVNRKLYDAVLSYYEDKLGAFNAAVSKVEDHYASIWLKGFDVSMWRNQEARAPRIAVTETAVSGMNYLRRIPTDVVGVATSVGHSLAIRANRTVVAWGDNHLGQCAVPADLNDVIGVSAGQIHSLALRKDGTIVAWGDNRFGQCDFPEHEVHTKIAAGAYHSLAVRGDGEVIAWGRKTYGACDVPEEAKTGVVDIAATGELELGDISLALKADGTAVAWGQWKGTEFGVPGGLSNIVAIGAGYGRAVAVKGDGTVVGWPTGPYDGPRVRDGVSGVSTVALGEYITLALKKDGMVEVIAGSIEGTPQTGGFIAIAAGRRHALALRDDGSLIVWGEDDARHGGCLSGAGNQLPVGVAGSDGEYLLLMEDGRATSLGIGIPSNLGHVSAIDIGATGFAKIGFCLALRADGTVVAWGDNRDGQCNVPKELSDVVAIAIGDPGSGPGRSLEGHCLALRSDGTVEAWGNDEYGQCKVPSDLENAVAIAAGWRHSLALRADGTVIAWGALDAAPADLAEVVAIAAGEEHNLALKADGTVVAWGNNTKGQCNVPKGLTGVVAITAGEGRSLALKADGTVVAWGLNDGYGQCDFAATQSGVLAMASGGWYPDSFLVSATGPSIENTEPLHFMRGEPPRAVMLRLRELCGHLLSEFDLDLNDSLNQLEGAKVLLESVVALGLPDSLDQDDVLRGFLFGSESLIDRDGARELYEAEKYRLDKEWKLRTSTLEEIPKARLESFRRRLDERLDDLEQSGTPEIPRMVAHTLLQLRLLRAAY